MKLIASVWKILWVDFMHQLQKCWYTQQFNAEISAGKQINTVPFPVP
jgi:hypothetical protein